MWPALDARSPRNGEALRGGVEHKHGVLIEEVIERTLEQRLWRVEALVRRVAVDAAQAKKLAYAAFTQADGLVLPRHGHEWLLVRSLPEQRELGGMLVVGHPRSGKGLLAVTQLLGAWQHHSAVCTDLKGELHAATAGWRRQHGKIVVLDPTGVGHRFDPLADRETEDDLYRAAQDILHVDGEGDGQAFTERAASMLAALFVAAKRVGIPCLPYARELIRQGLRAAGTRLDQIDPLLFQQLLADRLDEADWESRFLTGSWQRWSLADSSIDLFAFSPPFKVGMQYGLDERGEPVDDALPYDYYLELARSILVELHRVGTRGPDSPSTSRSTLATAASRASSPATGTSSPPLPAGITRATRSGAKATALPPATAPAARSPRRPARSSSRRSTSSCSSRELLTGRSLASPPRT